MKIGDLKAKRARELAKTRNQNRTPDGKIKVRLRERDRQKMDFKHAKEHAVEDTQIFRLAQREATDLTASTLNPDNERSMVNTRRAKIGEQEREQKQALIATAYAWSATTPGLRTSMLDVIAIPGTKQPLFDVVASPGSEAVRTPRSPRSPARRKSVVGNAYISNL